jgi:hypothetical protein
MYDPNVQTVSLPSYLAGMSPLQFSTAHQVPAFLIDPLQWYVLAALCPVNLLITDAQGHKLGYDPATGTTFDQIPAALYAAPNTQNQFMIFKDPPAGRYHLKVSAFGDGEFSLGLHQLAPGLGAPRRFLAEGFVHNGEVLEYDIDIQPDLPISNTPPIADAGPDRTVPAGPACKADVRLDGSASRDPDGEPLQYQWTGKFGFAPGIAPSVSLPVGSNDIRLVVLDGQNSGAEDSVRVTVTAPTPIVNAFAAEPSLLQPPDGSLREVKVVVDISNTCGSAACRIVSVESDEDDSHDWKITGPLAVKLRAQRSADGDGRTYKLRVECQIPGGDPIVKTVKVKVPPPGRMKGEGGIRHDHRDYNYKFDVSESRAGKYAGSLSLEVKHDDDDDARVPADKFRATRVDAVRFSNDDDLTPGGGLNADTVHASGVGAWNGKAGYTFELRATDAGEPGAGRDRFKIAIRDANGTAVARVDEKIDSGNNQSQKPPK